MNEEQRKAFEDLIRVAQTCSYTARGLWFYTKRGSQADAALRDMENRLDEAATAAHRALTADADSAATGQPLH